MGNYIADINLFRRGNNNAIRLVFNNDLPDEEPFQKALLERHVVNLSDSVRVQGIIEALAAQQPILYMDSNLSFLSTLLVPGLGDIFVDPDIIDISDAVTNEYPYIIDDDSEVGTTIALYRIMTYAGTSWEYATKYIAGMQGLGALIETDDNIEDNEIIDFLNRDDILDIVPNNDEGVIQWLRDNSFSFETYRLRQYGEVESFKFTKKYQSAWNSLNLNLSLDGHNENNLSDMIDYLNNTQQNIMENIYANN